MNTNDKSGMTIVEVLVSVVIISLVMSLLFTLLIQVQNANSITTEKSSLLISQAVITKAIEQDFIETGIKSVSRCNFSDFNHGELYNPNYDNICLRVEYNLSYDISDVGYIMIYKQLEKHGNDPKWMIRYARGYYQDCNYQAEPNSLAWVDTYTVVQKLEIAQDISLGVPKLEYSADYDSSKKYSMQKNNSGQLIIPIMDANKYHYNIDVSFSYKLYYDNNHPEKEYKFYCDDLYSFDTDVSSLICECHDTRAGVCDKTLISNTDKLKYNNTTSRNDYKYTCSETKFQSGVVTGIKNNVLSDSNVYGAGIRANNVSEVYFHKELQPDSISGLAFIDVSVNKNRSTLLYYKLVGDKYELHYAQEGGVTMFNPAGFFAGYTNLTKVDFDNLVITGNDYSEMFKDCESLTKDGLVNFNKLDMRNATSISKMFMGCANLTESPFKNLHGDIGNLERVMDASGLFNGSGIENFQLTNNDYNTDIRIPNVENLNEMLSNCSSLKKLTIANGNVVFDKLLYMDNFATGTSSLTEVTIRDFNASNLLSMKAAFKGAGASASEEVTRNGSLTITIANFQSPKLKDVSHFFSDSNVGSDKLVLDRWDLKSVENVSYMFSNTLLKKDSYMSNDKIYFKHINAGNTPFYFTSGTITNASHLFDDCVYLEKVELQYDIFKNVTDLSSLFEGCIRLKSIEVTDYDNNSHKIASDSTPKLLNASKMFMQTATSAGTLNYPGIFDDNFFENCTDFSYMFMNSGYKEIVLDNINSSVSYDLPQDGADGETKYVNLSYMFASIKWDEYSTNPDKGVGSVQNLKMVTLNNCNFKATLDMTKMFFGQDKLETIKLNNLYASDVTIDGDNAGYITNTQVDNMLKSVDSSKRLEIYLYGTYIPNNFFNGLTDAKNKNEKSRKLYSDIEDTATKARDSGKAFEII